MKITRHITKQIRALPKRFWPLTLWTIIFAGLTLVICADVSALVIQHVHNTAKQSHTTTSSAQSQTPNEQPVNPTTISTQNTPAKSTTPQQNTTPQTKTANNASDCSSVETEWEQTYSGNLKLALDASVAFTSTWTQSEVDTYNQMSQNYYNQAVEAVKGDGCTPNLTLSTLSLSDAPGGSNTPPAAPTCNTSLEASYEITYESQNQLLMEQESSDIQSLRAQLAIIGADNGTGWAEVPSIVAQQYAPQLDAIKNTLNSELASINCSGD